MTPHGTIWTAGSAAGRVLEWAPDGTLLRQVPVGGDTVAADRTGHIWTVNRNAGTVSRVAPDGRVILGGDGAGDTPDDGIVGPAVRLADPYAVAADISGIAWVTQSSSDR